MRTHIGVIFLIGCLSIVYSWPAFSHPTQTIPGVPGDNILFYWDLWRAQQAIANGENPLYTRCIFYPQGQSLVFHTNSVLHAALTYPLRQWLNVAAMYNLWAFGSFVIGGWGAYLLGRYLLGNDWAALLVAFVFSFSPFRISHMGNHMMLFSMHWMPFYVLFLLKLRDGNWWHGALAGCFLALTAWTDLHQAIHLLLFTAFTVAWWAGCATRHTLSYSLWPILRRLSVSAVMTALLTLPILIPSASAVLQHADGDTGKMPNAMDIRMRSARPINFLVPPARHPLWGWLGEENTEQQLTVGFGIISLCWVAWRWRSQEPHAVSYWLTASCWIVALTMGPILMLNSKYTLRLDGAEYNLPMPHALLDLIPGVNMARAPARFMGLGTLVIGVLAGYGIRHLLTSGRWKWAMTAATAMAIEFAGKPFPVLRIWTPPGLVELAKQDGAVIDLPFGVGSALRQSGHMDYYSILYQTAHGRPRVGGMVSRCSDQYRQQLLGEPLLGSLLRIYEGQEIDETCHVRDRMHAEETMRRYGIRHALLRPNQEGKTAHNYLRLLFPNAIEHAIDDSVWVEFFPQEQEVFKWRCSSCGSDLMAHSR
jgi:hypothetical protein